MRKRKSERGEKIKKLEKLRRERLHTFLYPAMEQCEQSGCFKLEKRSSNIHQTEGLINWRGHPKMVLER